MKRSNACTLLDTTDNNTECRQVSIRSFFGTTTATAATRTYGAASNPNKRRVTIMSPTTSSALLFRRQTTESSSSSLSLRRCPSPNNKSRSQHDSNSDDSATTTTKQQAHNNNNSRNKKKKASSSSSSSSLQQMYLDLGQRDFAAQQVCNICGMLYVHGVAEDLQQHAKICHVYQQGVPFFGEKSRRTAARIVATFVDNKNNNSIRNNNNNSSSTSSSIVEVGSCCDAKKSLQMRALYCTNARTSNKQTLSLLYKITSYFQVRPSDSYSLRKKVEQVQNIVVKDLGFAHASSSSLSVADKKSSRSASKTAAAAAATTTTTPRTVYLYIVNKRVVGLAVAQIIDRAYPVTAMARNHHDTLSSTSSSPPPPPPSTSSSSLGYERSTTHSCKAVLGIYQLWVHGQFRQRGIATRLVTTAREKLVFGFVVPVEQTAFSSPTESGLAFAQRYVMKGAAAGGGSSSSSSTAAAVLVYDTEP